MIPARNDSARPPNKATFAVLSPFFTLPVSRFWNKHPLHQLTSLTGCSPGGLEMFAATPLGRRIIENKKVWGSRVRIKINDHVSLFPYSFNSPLLGSLFHLFVKAVRGIYLSWKLNLFDLHNFHRSPRAWGLKTLNVIHSVCRSHSFFHPVIHLETRFLFIVLLMCPRDKFINMCYFWNAA